MSYQKPTVIVPRSVFDAMGTYEPIHNSHGECIEFPRFIVEPESVVLHSTEQKYPEQTQMFKEIINRMYCTHLEKNADYSPMNILSTGIVGICTRIWDKTARILNLMGWNLQTGEFSSERKSTKDESIEDNLLDLAVYCIIALIFRAGKWGK